MLALMEALNVAERRSFWGNTGLVIQDIYSACSACRGQANLMVKAQLTSACDFRAGPTLLIAGHTAHQTARYAANTH
jgi:hypothetical protein